MIVLDASVLIGHLDTSDAHHAAARALLVAAVDEQLWASPMTLAEVLVGPTRAGAAERAMGSVLALGVRATPWPEDFSLRLARMRVDTGLRMPDACVLVAAEQPGAGLATFDGRLADAARNRGIPVVP